MKVTSWQYTTMFVSLVKKLIGLFRTFSALFIGFFLAFGILWKSYGHQNNQGVNLVKVMYHALEFPASKLHGDHGGQRLHFVDSILKVPPARWNLCRFCPMCTIWNQADSGTTKLRVCNA